MSVIYARYNRHRLPPFQIETSIVELNGSRAVIKKALTAEAAGHIRAISAGYDLIKSNLNDGSLLLPSRLALDHFTVSFEYVDGNSLDRLLFLSFRADDRQSFFKIIDDYCALLNKAFRSVVQPEISQKISEVFGVNPSEKPTDAVGWMPLAAIDAVFENIIISGNKHYLIDIEWVFAGALPIEFVVFRSLFYFHQVKYFEAGIEKWISFDELLGHCHISPEAAGRYREMDDCFQAYVYGPERCYKYKEHYKKRQISVHSLERTIENQRDVVRKYHDEMLKMRPALEEKDRFIKEITNSFVWRFWLKIARAIDVLCPAGTRRRRLADRLIALLKARQK